MCSHGDAAKLSIRSARAVRKTLRMSAVQSGATLQAIARTLSDRCVRVARACVRTQQQFGPWEGLPEGYDKYTRARTLLSVVHPGRARRV